MNSRFLFEQLRLDEPVGIQGGAYLSKLRMKRECLLQTPPILLKSGIHIHADKRGHVDIMWDLKTHDGKQMHEFMDKFERHLRKQIYQYREQWFDGDIDEDDIDYFFQSATKSYQTDYEVMRLGLSRLSKTMIQRLPEDSLDSQKYGVRIFNEEEQTMDIGDVSGDSMNKQPVILMVEPYGVKFTSSSFHVVYYLRQMMVLNNPNDTFAPVLQTCLIRRDRPRSEPEPEPRQEDKEDKEDKEEESNHTSHSSQSSRPASASASTLNALFDTTKDHAEEQAQEAHKNENTENENKNKNNKEENDSPATSTHAQDTQPTQQEPDEFVDVELEFPTDDSKPISLKHPNQVYFEMYQDARLRAKQARQEAFNAYLEAKNIRTTYELPVDDELEKEFQEFASSKTA